MTTFRLILLSIMACLLAFGCAEKQEDVDKMEQEMMAQDGQTTAAVADVDSIGSEIPVDEPSATPDAGAIPEEAQFQDTRPAGGGYTVQVAACENLEYADYLVSTFVTRGYEPFMTSTVEDGQTFYRVRVGSFEGYSEAKALRAELVDKYSIHEAWIDQVSE
jgi:cell division septation protein DedD